MCFQTHWALHNLRDNRIVLRLRARATVKSCVTPEVFPNENGNYFFITRRRNVRALDRLHYPMTARFNHRAHHTLLASDFSFTFNCLRTSLKSNRKKPANCQLSDGLLMFQFRNGEFIFLPFNLQRQLCQANAFLRNTTVYNLILLEKISCSTTSSDYWLFVCQSNCWVDYRLASAMPTLRLWATRSSPNSQPKESCSSEHWKRKDALLFVQLLLSLTTERKAERNAEPTEIKA